MKSLYLTRLYLTENCDASCAWCFNKNTRDPNKDMDTAKCKQLLDYLSENGIWHLKLMGGEPTMHPDFVEIWKYAAARFSRIILYTNGHYLDKLKAILPYYNIEHHSINFNFALLNNLSDADLFTKLAYIRTEVVIKLNTKPEQLLEKIQRLQSEAEHLGIAIKFILTMDCTLNFFKYKNEMLSITMPILNFAAEHPQMLWGWDHRYPKCFFTAEMLEKIKLISGRRPELVTNCKNFNGCYGLITSDFKLTHCNQYQANKIDLFTPSGGIIPFKNFSNFLDFESFAKFESLRNTSCSSCFHLFNGCNGGCVAHKFEH